MSDQSNAPSDSEAENEESVQYSSDEENEENNDENEESNGCESASEDEEFVENNEQSGDEEMSDAGEIENDNGEAEIDVENTKGPKNPLGLKKFEVLARLKNKEYSLINVPENCKATADYWNDCIFFIADKKGGIITNWFGCSQCPDWVGNCHRSDGTGAIRQHVKRHEEQTYKFSRSVFIKLQHQLTKIGHAHGVISEDVFKKDTPYPKVWTAEYLNMIKAGSSSTNASKKVKKLKEQLKKPMPISAKKKIEKEYQALLQTSDTGKKGKFVNV